MAEPILVGEEHDEAKGDIDERRNLTDVPNEAGSHGKSELKQGNQTMRSSTMPL
jgi:hypothetical protein